MGGTWLLLAVLASSSPAPEPSLALPRPSVRLERVTTPNNGELITLYRSTGSGQQIPVLAVLRDSLGANSGRLRYVWVLTARKPAWYQYVLAGIPYFYTRMPAGLPSANKKPGPILDLDKPADKSVAKLAASLLQTQAFDPLGPIIRTPTRSFHQNAENRQQVQVAEALAAISELDNANTSPEWQQVRARLLLSTKTFGGWVQDRSLPTVNAKDITRIEEMRGHNWDLLRQSAEANGLVFQPIRLAGGPPSHAILWASQADVQSSAPSRPFHAKFLKIASPWGDERLQHWTGHVETRDWDGDRVSMIPLALYSLDHPKVPFLLADMRDGFGPQRREIFRRAITDTTAGVLGVSKTANLGLFAGIFAWQFITSRWGAANDRSWRVRSYAELRYKLALDTTVEPALRRDLAKRTNRLDMNPFSDSLERQAKIAAIQHEALLKWALSDKGAAKSLNKDRREELALRDRSEGKRIWASVERIGTFGLYRQRAADVPASYARLAELRTVEAHRRLLEDLLEKGGSHPEVAWNLDAVRNAVFELGQLRPSDPEIGAMVNKFLKQIGSEEARTVCTDAWREALGGTPDEIR